MNQSRLLSFMILAFLFLITPLLAQTMILEPPRGYNQGGSTPVIKVFYGSNSEVVLRWSKNLSGTQNRFRVGTSSGNYGLGAVSVSGVTTSFTPGSAPLSLSTGRYYGLITNSSQTTLSGIQSNFNSTPGIDYSNEVQFVVESPTAPTPSAPRGTISNSTPQFQWNSIPGVAGYWIIVSSTPFVVRTDSTGNPSVQGANIVWDYITTNNSAQYGSISPSTPFTQSAIPLISGTTYYYTVLNMYDATNIAFASTVFGGVVTFTYQSTTSLAAPNLVSPAANTIFYGSETIRFQWDVVPNANSYSVYLFNRVTQFAGSNQEIDLPLWNGTTTNNLIDFPARLNLIKGKYVWFVIPNSTTGAGSASQTRVFNYEVPTAKFRARAISSVDNTNLTNFEFTIASTTSGYSPSVPYVVSNSSSFTDSIPVDIYRFTGKKQGYFDTTVTVSLNQTSLTEINFMMRPFPSIVSGTVRDQSGATVSSASVKFTNNLNGSVSTGATSSSGTFSFTLPKGSYSVVAGKAGYLSNTAVQVNVDTGQILISSPIVLTVDAATISGKVVNDENAPVQLAIVKATKGSETQEVSTNSTGNYTFNISSGSWTIEVSKTGFVSPAPRTLTLNTGDNLQNQNFTLIPRANQVTGFVYQVSSSGTGQVPVGGVTVSATPVSGQTVTTVTGSNGQYTLSLKNGSYTISVAQTGYTPSSSTQLTLTVAQTVSGVNFTLTPNPSTVNGLVTDLAGAPLSGATVSVQGVATTTSLSTGNYSLSLPSGTHTLTVTRSGYVTPASATVTVNPGQNLAGINFQMSANAAVISGRVSSLGQALPGATVTATNGVNTFTVVTNNNGDYSFSLTPGTWRKSASKSGFLTSAVDTSIVGPGQTSSNNNYNLVQNTAVVNGSIRSNSLPVAGVTVLMTDNTNSSNTFSTVSSISGDYALTVEAGRSYTQTLSKTGYATVTQTTASLAAGSTTSLNGTINAVPSSVAGRVLVGGLPLSGVAVSLVNTGTGVVLENVTTNLNGEYSIGAAAGSYRLRAFRAGYTRDSLAITLALGQALTNITFNLNENFALVTGTVKDGTGGNLGGVVVNLSGSSGGATATTSDNGTYSLQRVTGGVYTLTFSKPGYSESTTTNFTITDGQSVISNATLNVLAGRITGAVSLAAGGALGGATVTAVNATGQSFAALTDDAGNYTLSGLATGSYTVTASRSGYRSSMSVNVSIILTALNGTANINDFVQNTSVISGAVRDASGNGILNATVSLTGAAGAGNTVTNSSGEYTLSNLAPGTYTVTASAAGYASSSQTVTLANTATVFIPLVPNTVRVSGVVVNQNALALGFSSTLRMVSTLNVYTAATNSAGAFEFPEVSSGATYRIYTEIFREGHRNDTVTVNIPAGATSVPNQSLVIRVSTSTVSGSAGTDGAAITVRNNTSGETRTINSSSSGTFLFEYLTSGSYTITPAKSGFAFSPASQNFSLDGSNSQTVNFTASANSGSVSVRANNSSGVGIEQVNITLVSSDAVHVFNGLTSTAGTVTFNNVPAATYTLRASLTGYSASPSEKSVVVGTGTSANETFVMTRNTASIAGVIRGVSGPNTVALDGAQITIRNTATGQLLSANSDANGAYRIDNISSGNSVITASKTGYSEATENITITAGSSLNNKNYDLTTSSVTLIGRVLFNGTGVGNVSVTASSANNFTVVTTPGGDFTIASVPVGIGANDTTNYLVTISGQGIVSQSKVVRIASSQVGSIVTVDNFLLPSGQIIFTIFDGVNPLPNVKVTLIKPDASQTQAITTSTGLFTSSTTLPKGEYRFAFEAAGLMLPDETEFFITLPSDTTKVERTLGFRYTHIPVTRVLSDSGTLMQVKVNGGITTITGTVYYRNENQSEFTPLVMTLNSGVLSGTVPAQNSLEKFHYYIKVKNNATGVVYSTDEYEVTPLASGILTQASLEPSLNNIILRQNDEYDLQLVLRDGTNQSLVSKFTGSAPEGRVVWQASAGSGLEIRYPDSNDSTKVKIKPTLEGSFILTISATYRGSSARVTQTVQSLNAPLASIRVSSNANKLSNTSPGIQFSFAGLDTNQRSIYLGSSLQWSISPAAAGTISSTGFFKPADSTFIGTVTVTAKDLSGSMSGSTDLSVFAQLLPSTSTVLTNKEGMTLSISSGSVPGPLNITIAKPQFGPGKKNYNPVSRPTSYVVSDRQYSLTYEADFALRGDSLLQNATLNVPLDNSLKFFDGATVLGYYDPNTNEWDILDAAQVPKNFGDGQDIIAGVNDLSYGTFRRFGEYSLLTENQPLGIKYLAVLPTPFSPEVSQARIGYFLNSAQPPASVTIRIFNMRGELVRTLLQDDLQFPGRYGSRAGIKEIFWDGKTDDGLIARNGRYVMQVVAKDGSGEVKELTSIVLVK